MPRKRKREWSVIDPATGELVEAREVEPRRRGGPRKADGTNWVRLFQDEMWRIAALKGNELRVFHALVARTAWDVTFHYSNKEVAQSLGMQESTVSQATRVLREHGILIPMGNRTFWLDPRLVWRGTNDARNALLDSMFPSSTLDTESRKDPA